MEDHAKDPTSQPEVAEQQVVLAQRIRSRNCVAELTNSPVMCDEIGEAEEHREGLLHAEEAVERPFAMELDNGRGRLGEGSEACVRYDMLASVVAFGGTVP